MVAKAWPPAPTWSLQAFVTLLGEKATVLDHARWHLVLWDWEVAWRMFDEEVAYLSPSTVYWILK
jgi:hypothetical protein